MGSFLLGPTYKCCSCKEQRLVRYLVHLGAHKGLSHTWRRGEVLERNIFQSHSVSNSKMSFGFTQVVIWRLCSGDVVMAWDWIHIKPAWIKGRLNNLINFSLSTDHKLGHLMYMFACYCCSCCCCVQQHYLNLHSFAFPQEQRWIGAECQRFWMLDWQILNSSSSELGQKSLAWTFNFFL